MPDLLVIQGDAARIPLMDQSVHCVTVSPPYFGLRSYRCASPYGLAGPYCPVPGSPPITIPAHDVEVLAACVHTGGQNSADGARICCLPQRVPVRGASGRICGKGLGHHLGGHFCQQCGALRCCLGNEPAPSFYVWHTLLWLREAWRILRDDGVVWLVIADSFSSGDRQGHGTRVGHKQQTNRGMNGTADPARAPQPQGYPQGTLLGIPAQVQLAAMGDGWTVRDECVCGQGQPYARIRPGPPLGAQTVCLPHTESRREWHAGLRDARA